MLDISKFRLRKDRWSQKNRNKLIANNCNQPQVLPSLLSSIFTLNVLRNPKLFWIRKARYWISTTYYLSFAKNINFVSPSSKSHSQIIWIEIINAAESRQISQFSCKSKNYTSLSLRLCDVDCSRASQIAWQKICVTCCNAMMVALPATSYRPGSIPTPFDTSSARFCKILQDSARFCKILKYSARFSKIKQDFATFIKKVIRFKLC